MPRMRAVVETSLVVEVTGGPGVSSARSLMSFTPKILQQLVGDRGHHDRHVLQDLLPLCAVTTISSTVVGVSRAGPGLDGDERR